MCRDRRVLGHLNCTTAYHYGRCNVIMLLVKKAFRMRMNLCMQTAAIFLGRFPIYRVLLVYYAVTPLCLK